jgi:hypothetical protein
VTPGLLERLQKVTCVTSARNARAPYSPVHRRNTRCMSVVRWDSTFVITSLLSYARAARRGRVTWLSVVWSSKTTKGRKRFTKNANSVVRRIEEGRTPRFIPRCCGKSQESCPSGSLASFNDVPKKRNVSIRATAA